LVWEGPPFSFFSRITLLWAFRFVSRELFFLSIPHSVMLFLFLPLSCFSGLHAPHSFPENTLNSSPFPLCPGQRSPPSILASPDLPFLSFYETLVWWRCPPPSPTTHKLFLLSLFFFPFIVAGGPCYKTLPFFPPLRKGLFSPFYSEVHLQGWLVLFFLWGTTTFPIPPPPVETSRTAPRIFF